MKRLSIITLQYYRSLWIYNVAFTVSCVLLMLANGESLGAGLTVLSKIVGYLSAAGLYHFSSQQSYIYYRNTGHSMRLILLMSALLELIMSLAIYVFFILIV